MWRCSGTELPFKVAISLSLKSSHPRTFLVLPFITKFKRFLSNMKPSFFLKESTYCCLKMWNITHWNVTVFPPQSQILCLPLSPDLSGSCSCSSTPFSCVISSLEQGRALVHSWFHFNQQPKTQTIFFAHTLFIT